jgi:hypothetical protein
MIDAMWIILGLYVMTMVIGVWWGLTRYNKPKPVRGRWVCNPSKPYGHPGHDFVFLGTFEEGFTKIPGAWVERCIHCHKEQVHLPDEPDSYDEER